MTGATIRAASAGDRAAIEDLLRQAFGGEDEARLVRQLWSDGDGVLELVDERDGEIAGHVMFSRLAVAQGSTAFAAVALAPLAVRPRFQRQGIGSALIETAHRRLEAQGEGLSVVLGEPAYYGRFGYSHGRAARYLSDYQCEALQALAWRDEAPATGRLVYAPAFQTLSSGRV